MRTSFKLILCLVSSDIIIIAIVMLCSFTGVTPANNNSPKNPTKELVESVTTKQVDESVTISSSETEQATILNEDNNLEVNSEITEMEQTLTINEELEITTTLNEATTTAIPDNTFVVINSTSTVYLRESASTVSKSLCEIPVNSTGTVISKEDNWTKVEFNGQTGYIFSEYIVTGSSAADFIVNKNTNTVIINNTCYLRGTPDTSSPIIGNAPAGTEYQFIPEKSNEQWYAIIMADGSTNYISTGFASVK